MPSRRRAKSTQERPPSPPSAGPIARATRSHKSLSSQSQNLSFDSLPPQRRSNRSAHKANDAHATVASKAAGSRESPEGGGVAMPAASKAISVVDESRDDDGDDGNDGDSVMDDIENKTPERVVTASSPHSSGGEGHSSDGGGGDAVSSTSARKGQNSSTRKPRRKKPRNPHIPPQKQRQLRKKQRERVQKRREIPYSPPGATATTSGQPPAANNAFEEDFGPLLRGEVVTGNQPDPPDDDQVDVSLVEATADFLLDAAMGGFSARRSDREGRELLEASARRGFPIHSVGDPPARSPPRQPFLQEEKEPRAALSAADSNIASSPGTVHEALEKPTSGQGFGGFEEQRALGERRQPPSPADMRAISAEGHPVKERSPEGSTKLIVGDSPPTLVDGNQEPATGVENGNNIPPPTAEGSKASDITEGDGAKAATVLLQIANSGTGASTTNRKRGISDMSLSLDDIMTSPCPTCDVTLTKILKYQGRSLADLAMDPKAFMEKHNALCLRKLREEIFSDADSDDHATTMGDSDQNAGRGPEEHGPVNGRSVHSDGQEGYGGGDNVSSGNGEPAEGRIDASLREERTQSPEEKRKAELRKRLQFLTYLTLPVGMTFEKEAEIRREVIKSGRLPEGRTVGDLLNIPITPFSEFQATLDVTKTDEEKFLVEEMIARSLYDMQMEYFMIDEAVRCIEAEIDTSESETRGSGERRGGATEVLSIPNPLEPEDSVVWEDKKEADLYGFPYDPSAKRRGNQNPAEQTGGKYSMRGRELRSRSKPIELPLYPGYEHYQRNQALQTKLTRRRKLATEKEKGVEASTETLRADSVPPQPSVVAPRKRPGRPPKNPPVLQAAPKDQTFPALLSHTGSADGYSISPPAEQFVDPQNSAGGLENVAPTKCLHVRFSLARRGELGGILSRQPNPLRVSSDSAGESLVPTVPPSMPVAPSQFYHSERQTGQSDSFLNSPSGVRSESPHGQSAPEGIMPKLEAPTKSGDKSRVRNRVRVRNRAPRRAADLQPAPGSSASGIETPGASISADQQEPSKTTPGNSVVRYSTEADSAASDGGQSFHSNAFQSSKKTPGGSPRRMSGNPPAVMQFSSTPSPMHGVFSSHSPFPPGTSDLDPYRPRVRGKTYKTPTSVTRPEAPPKTTTEEEFLAAQNGNLGKRKRVKTALAYEAQALRRRGKADGEDDGEEEDDIFSESSEEEPDEDDSGGYGKKRRKRR